jgi:shikimate kinase
MNRRIVILGFMACGKTTVAKELAHQLDCDYVDLDSFIAKRHGRSAAEIIQQDGEERFRELETLALRDVLQSKDARVIALGGGTWTIPANRTLTALHDCETVWLDVPFEVCWNRIVAAATARPLAPDRETAWSRYESRRADYGLANRRIAVTESDSVSNIAEQVGREP